MTEDEKDSTPVLENEISDRINLYIEASIDKLLENYANDEEIKSYDNSHDFKFKEYMDGLFNSIEIRWESLLRMVGELDPLSAEIAKNLRFMFFMHVFAGGDDDKDPTWMTTTIETMCGKITVSMMLCVFVWRLCARVFTRAPVCVRGVSD